MLSIVAGLLDWLTLPLAFLVVLTIVVFVHELGHFLVARWCGVKVKTFSIGFGPELWGFTDRHGTRWMVAPIPLGGYVKFMDDENATSQPSREALDQMSPEERDGSFHAKPVWQRAAVVAAGPLINFLLAIVIFGFWFWTFGIHSSQAKVDDVVAGSPAAAAGFKAGDVIREINGRKIASFEDVQMIVATAVGRELDVQVERGGGLTTLKVVPKKGEQKDEAGKAQCWVGIGIKRVPTPETTTSLNPSLPLALWLGTERVGTVISGTLGFLGEMVVGRQCVDQLGGPARIADIAGKVARKSWLDLIFLTGFISVSIGLINLFPIPMLDGGHLMFYAFEALRGRPLSERTIDFGFRVGMAIVLSLMIFAFYNDSPIIRGWFTGGR